MRLGAYYVSPFKIIIGGGNHQFQQVEEATLPPFVLSDDSVALYLWRFLWAKEAKLRLS